MSDYYKPDRNPNWNYGGEKWRLSRSKIEIFWECPRCFYIDNKLGTGRPRGPAFTLNVAVDALLKKEFDIHRVKNTTHPLLKAYGLDAIPYQHEDLWVWRENFKGVEYRHPPTGLIVCGALDDVWVTPNGELIVVDYKATSKDEKIESLEDSAWAAQYARQIGVYQWLLRNNGHKVSDTGYFLYANASSDKDAFDGRLEFELTLVPCKGDAEWVDGVLVQIKRCLDSSELPASSPDCDFCRYREAVGKKLMAFEKKPQKKTSGDGTLGI